MSSDQMTQQISTADALGKYESKMEKLKAGIDRRNDFISCPPSSTNLTNATSTTASVRADIARLRVVVDTVAKKLDRQHDRGQSEIWEKLALLKKQLVESVDRSTASCEETRADNMGARALAAETHGKTILDQRDVVPELISSRLAEERERNKELVAAAVAEAHEGLVSAGVVGGKERKTRRGGKGRGGRGSGSSKKKLGDGGGDRDPSPVPSDPGDAVG